MAGSVIDAASCQAARLAAESAGVSLARPWVSAFPDDIERMRSDVDSLRGVG